MAYAIYGLPILIGFIVGYFLTLPVNIALSIMAVLVAAFMLWTTRKAELGAIVGILAALIGFVFIATQWATIAISSNAISAIDLTWLFKS